MVMKYDKIPKSYNVGGTKIEVCRVDRCDDDCIGKAYTAAGYIEIADTYGKDKKQSESCKVNTFYHELTHTILQTMGEFELSDNEKFVNSFASFLTEAMSTAYYAEESVSDNKSIVVKQDTQRRKIDELYDWYVEHHKEIYERWGGLWVVVSDNGVEPANDVNEADRIGTEKYGEGNFLMCKCKKEIETVYIA